MKVQEKRKIFIFAGEESGDIRGAELIKALKKISPSLHIDAVGGEKMKAAGAHIIFDITGLAVVGFVEVLKHYTEFRKLMKNVVEILSQENYSAIILIDYPGFNLRLAKRIRHLQLSVIYYISPQVWAWGKRRSREIACLVDKMIVLFDFEKDIYTSYGLETTFVGHPMVDMISGFSPEDLKKRLHITEEEKLIGFLPGSRVKEVEKILPSMLDAIELYKERQDYSPLRFIISSARKDLKEIIQKMLEKRKSIENVTIYEGSVSHVLASSDIIVVASGTATLQTCLFEKPMIVVYKVAFLTWAIAKILIKIPYIAMVNVVSGKKIVPELVQWGMTGDRIMKELTSYLQDDEYRVSVIQELHKVKERLGSGGAADKAARSIVEFIDRKK